MALLIREDEVRSLLSMEEAIEAVEEVFKLKAAGRADNRPRQRPRLEHAMLQAMPGAVEGVGLGLKAYTVTPAGVRFLVLLWDHESGELLAMIEAGELGRIRTGAASGVATKHLARSDSRTVGVIGTGYQAAAQLEAVCAVRPIDEAVVYSRGEARRRAFAEECSARLGITVRAVDRPQDAAACDIVATITNATDPVLDAGGVGRGTHINAAGNNRADHAEIAADLLDAASMVFIDDIQQGKAEAGEIIRAVDAGGFAWNRVAELGDLVAGRVSGRSDAAEITLFKSIGIAIEDIAVARRVYALATARGAGEALPGSSLWSTID